MKIEILRNPDHKDAYDLWVDGVLQVKGESMQVCDNVKYSLQHGAPGHTEADDVARSILKAAGKVKIIDARGMRILDIFKIDDKYPAHLFWTTGLEHIDREYTEVEINDFVKHAQDIGAAAVLIQEYGLTAYVPRSNAAPIMPQTVKGQFYWTARDEKTGEVAEYFKPYTSAAHALGGGRAFIKRSRRDKPWIIEVWPRRDAYAKGIPSEKPVTSERVMPSTRKVVTMPAIDEIKGRPALEIERSYSLDQIRAMARAKGLSPTGTKMQVISRLRAETHGILPRTAETKGKATVIRVDGSKKVLDHRPSLEESQKIVGGWITFTSAKGADGKTVTLVVDEEGLLKNKPANHTIMSLYGRDLVGDVIVLEGWRTVGS